MPDKEKIWSVLEMIRWGTGYLEQKGFDEARLSIELLLSETLGVKRFDLYVRHDQPLSKSELEKFKGLLKRRLNREPIQYILGKVNFYSIEMKIDRRALIPRPETETLVEAVVEYCKRRTPGEKGVSILDIGTGSGCIDVVLARFVRDSHITSIDSSKEALELAAENAALTGTKDNIRFLEADFLKMDRGMIRDRFDVIVSNPPYVSETAFATLDSSIRNF